MVVLALWIVCAVFVLILVFTALGMPFAAAWTLVSPRKQRFCLQCHSTDALRWPYVCKVCRSRKTISAAAPIASEFAAIPNPAMGMGAPPHPQFPKPGISRSNWRFIGWGSAIAVGIFALFVIIGNLLPSPPSQLRIPASTQSTPAATNVQANAPHAAPATDDQDAQTPEETEEDKQDDTGWKAIELVYQALSRDPSILHESERLRFDAVVVMPDKTVCLPVHFVGNSALLNAVQEPSAFFYIDARKELFAETDVSMSLWTQECIDQQGGIDVFPDIENHINYDTQQMEYMARRMMQTTPDNSITAPDPTPSQSSPAPTQTTLTPGAPQEETDSSMAALAVAQGQTPDQVLAILGPPISITTGAKHVYTYPQVMIVFTDGKVSEIHQIQ